MGHNYKKDIWACCECKYLDVPGNQYPCSECNSGNKKLENKYLEQTIKQHDLLVFIEKTFDSLPKNSCILFVDAFDEIKKKIDEYTNVS